MEPKRKRNPAWKDTPEQKAARKYHGEFARLNFPAEQEPTT